MCRARFFPDRAIRIAPLHFAIHAEAPVTPNIPKEQSRRRSKHKAERSYWSFERVREDECPGPRMRMRRGSARYRMPYGDVRYVGWSGRAQLLCSD